MSTKPIWSPSEDLVAQSNLTSFQKYINSKYNTNLKTYDALHKWSVNSLNDFWSSLILFSLLYLNCSSDRTWVLYPTPEKEGLENSCTISLAKLGVEST